jgi:hypothetical protein
MNQSTDQHHRFHYQPYYCEENAWWLCADPVLGPGPRGVLFISGLAGHCPFLHQRASAPGDVLWWDYHCVCLDGSGRIWDLDSRLPLPTPALDWLARTFAFGDELPARWRPRFRLVPAAEFRRDFASDRRHMRSQNGEWRQPPPPWPTIGNGWNLDVYRDIRTPGPGELLDLEALRKRLCSPERPTSEHAREKER